MKLIRELTEDFEVLHESNDGKKSLYIEGVFLQSEIKNRNGRCYPRSVMESAVDKYVTEKVSRKTAYGEFGHPEGPKVNETLISHLIESLDWQGNNVIGRAKIFPVGNGAIITGILENGGRLGVSSRGLGSLKNNNGIMEVQNDFWLSTAADVVTDPSAPDAFVNGVMESADWILAAGGEWVQEAVNNIKRDIDNTSKINLEAKKIQVFESFMSRLNKGI